MKTPTLNDVRRAYSNVGHKIFNGIDSSGKNVSYDLNIFGVRTQQVSANVFDDFVGVFWMDWEAKVWQYSIWPATTDPGAYWLANPENMSGTAILVEGQYPASHKIGKHKGTYEALVQNSPLKVYRDPNKDKVMNMDPSKVQVGNFGINIHRASAHSPSQQVDKWSAGCQVIADPTHFSTLMDICFEAGKQWSPIFTYTLLAESSF